jgi:hypothetical protein
MPELFTIPFDGGIHQDIDPAVAKEGTLERVTDGRIPRQGGIVKRFPNETVPQTVEPTGVSQAFGSARPHAAAPVKGRDVVALAGRAYARDAETTPSWVEVARPANFIPRRAHFIALDESASVASSMHIAALGNSICGVYAETETPPSGAVTNVVIILSDASMVRRATFKVASRDLPRVFAVGTKFVVTYKSLDGTATNFYGRTLDPTTSVLGGETSIQAKVGANDAYDAAPFDATRFVFIARSAAALMRIRLVDLTFAAVANQTVACPNSQTKYVRVYGTPGEGVWGAWVDASVTTANLFVTNATVTAVTGGPTAAIGNVVLQLAFTRASATSVWLVYTDTFGNVPGMGAELYDTTAANLSSRPHPWGTLPASSPFNGDPDGFSIWVSNQGMPVAGYTSAGANRYICVRVDPADYYIFGHHSILKVDLTAALTADYVNNGQPPAVAVRSERQYFPARERLGNFSQSLFVYEYEDTSTRRGAWRQIVECCQAGIIAGGHLQEIPSDRSNSGITAVTRPERGFDNGFLKAPDINLAAAAGGTLPAGTYQVAVVFEYVDVDGRRHQSEPSAAVPIVAALNDKITVTFVASSLSERELSTDQVRGVAVAYMTTAGGSTFYRMTPVVRSANTLGFVVSPTLSIVLPNPPVTSSEPMYTAGGALRNSPCPSHRFALFSHDALWVCGMWDPRMIERSKTIVPGTPPRFTLADQFRAIAPFDVSALAELDGQILVLGVDGLAVMNVGGPNDQGNPALEAPSFLSPLGLIPGGETAVIRVPAGVIYPGRRGLYLAPRGGGDPEFLGSPIQSDLANVYGAAAHAEPNDGSSPASRLVAFLIEDASGQRFVAQLDEDSLQWVSVDTLGQATEIVGSWNGAAVYLPLNATTQAIQRRASMRATSSQSTVTAQTDHCRPFGLLGFGYARRVQLLATIPADNGTDPPTITLYFGRDGAALTALTATHSPNGSGVMILEWQLPGDQPCNSFRFRVEASAKGIGAKLHGLTVEVDGVPDLARVPVVQRK